MYKTIEEKIKDRLKDLTDIKDVFVVSFRYGYIDVEKVSRDLENKTRDELKNELEKLKNNVNSLLDRVDNNNSKFNELDSSHKDSYKEVND